MNQEQQNSSKGEQRRQERLKDWKRQHSNYVQQKLDQIQSEQLQEKNRITMIIKYLKDPNKTRMITTIIKKRSTNNNGYEDYNRDKQGQATTTKQYCNDREFVISRFLQFLK